jgi:hypothetical protein
MKRVNWRKGLPNSKAVRPTERARRSQFAEGKGPLRTERAGASESLGRGEVALSSSVEERDQG